MTSPALVSLVGAGPGHSGLLTLRAVQCLREADLVLYDKLVPAYLLSHARADAEKVCIAELAPTHAQRHRPIHARMIEASQEGKRVVRLKGGDPFIFGRGGEEAEVLRQAGIPFEIIPGVTCALGAAAFAGIPLTHRDYSSAVCLLTGVENPNKSDSNLDWKNLAHFPGTLVVYMGLSRLDKIAATLIAHGKDPDTPTAVVHWATTGEQQTRVAPLSEIAARVRNEGLTPPAIVIIGSVVTLRDQLNWYEHLPLLGRRVLVTRPRQQAGELVERLVALGAVPFVLPTVEIQEPADWSPVDDAIAQLGNYHWLVFTSVNGVRAFMERLRLNRRDLRALGHMGLAAIGPRTADALRSYHLDPDVVPGRFQSEDLAAALKQAIAPGQRVLYARADRGRDVMRQELAEHCELTQVAVYAQIDAVEMDPEILDHLRRGEIDDITLTSANIARSLIEHLDTTTRERIVRGDTRLVSLSPVTSAEIARLGLPVALEAREATMSGLIQAMLDVIEK